MHIKGTISGARTLHLPIQIKNSEIFYFLLINNNLLTSRLTHSPLLQNSWVVTQALPGLLGAAMSGLLEMLPPGLGSPKKFSLLNKT